MRIRPSKEEIDEEVLDTAAGLLARRGVKGTSIQAVADATGYSKAGILNRFTSKDALIERAVQQCGRQTRTALHTVSDLPCGPARDAAALVTLTELALRRPGYITLVSAFMTPLEEPHLQRGLELLGEDFCRMFCLPGPRQGDLERWCRVIGALGALCTLAVATPDHAPVTVPLQAQPHILATAWSALGHGMALGDAQTAAAT
ncbi:helix-turn-helix domain-containing protein [Streptomyces sp. NPDC051662]|uniref:TetR/AcrR family transcriptional regulator n=1 Tax=Streptomyces sp. NPDC051662 TaxID=3154750 RepID=UPI00342BF295